MKQLPLFGDGDLVPIRQYLHVWTDAERAERIKKPRAEAQGEVPQARGEERVAKEGADK